MRTIKFRGKRVDNGEWVEGYLTSIACNCLGSNKIKNPFYKIDERLMIHPLNSYDNNEVKEIDPKTVGHFTGLTDKNGVEIYEGDVCEVRYLTKTPTVSGTVEWYNNHSHFSIRTKKDGSYSLSFGGSVVDGVYITGNIHDKEKSEFPNYGEFGA